MAAGTIQSLSDYLVRRGTFTGDIDDTTILPGIYYIQASNSYTHTTLDAAEVTIPSYCTFIQFPYVNAQLFISDYVLVRKRTGNPQKWRTHQYVPDKSYIPS